MVEKAIRLFTGFAVNIYMINYLGKAVFGDVSYVLTIAAFLTGLATFGISNHTITRLSRNRERYVQILQNDFTIRLFFGVNALLLTLVYVIFYESSEFIILGVVLLSLNHILQPVRVYEDLQRARANQKTLAKYYFIQNLIISLSKLMFVLMELNPYAILWVYFLENLILTAIFSYRLFKTEKVTNFTHIKMDEIRKVVITCMPLFLASVVTSVAWNIDKIIIYQKLSAEALGVYTTAVMLISAFHFIPGILTSTFIPMVVNIDNENDRAEMFTNLYRIFLWLGLAIFIFFLLTSGLITQYLFSDEFELLKHLLPWLSLSLPILFIGAVTNAFLMSQDQVWLVFFRQLISTIFTITILLISIDDLGVFGAVLASLVGFFFGDVLCDLFSQKTRQHFLYKTRSLNFLLLSKSIRFIKN